MESEAAKIQQIVINGETKTFKWGNVTNPSFYPQVSVVDLDADGEDEVVIVLIHVTSKNLQLSYIMRVGGFALLIFAVNQP
ncbi:hypothetical protein [Paenibacillus pabuli]|uniref:hypothetical protein n=1 Tax=Paenibacillus pabuli TaxID=1472 RepID=UPI00078436F4|nr:hypothetical protein [Paenibacillus pabuli]MEC0123132.1 hypothetical protein [Paenibacillus pabuli]